MTLYQSPMQYVPQGTLLSKRQSGGSIKLTPLLHLVRRFRVSFTLLQDFMARYLIKKKDNFTSIIG
jgi:hypothetical protein